MRYRHAILPSLIAVAAVLVESPVAAEAPAEQVDYERDIRPLLFQKCAACHGALQQVSGLRLDAGVLIREGGESGPAVQPGDSAASLLIERVSETDPDMRMPPEGEGEALTAEQIDLLSRWIDAGAESPANETIPEDPAHYWSYQPVVRPEVPPVPSPAWVREPLDAFIAAKHHELGLHPRPEAPREVWLRRVFLDLIGLPPTRKELQAFLADDSPWAYEKVVDSLLDRPEYGERWGRHWMDVWRYSDWYGSRAINEIRYSQRNIWRWRDWIIESLSADKPYDRMVVEMLAGDEVAPADPEVLRATGFLGRNWYKFDRNVWMFETVEHTSQAFLGLTLRCARCHDHKFDPIAQEDYYRFRAFFEPHDVRTDPLRADAPQEKDATLGFVLAEGVARVFDKEPQAKTFLFERGDDRSPDESRPLSPGVPPALQGAELEIQPVALPVEAYYPSLRPEIAEGLIRVAEGGVGEAKRGLAEAREEAARARQAVVDFQDRIERGEGADAGPLRTILSDNFASRTEVWEPVSGSWSWEGDKLVESSVSNFATIVASVTPPPNFQARVKYRTLQPGAYRSVGFSFDYIDGGNSQDVYTSANDANPAIQVFHRQNGKQEYPQAGIVKTPVAVGEVVTVEITARGQQLSVSLNGQPKLEYVMPVARREGKFALWVHQGSAEFLEVDLQELLPTLADLRQKQQTAEDRIAVAESQLRIAHAEVASVRARVAAERAKYLGQNEQAASEQAAKASRAERQVDVAKAEQVVLQAEQLCRSVRDGESAATGGDSSSAPASQDPPAPSAGLVEAEKKLTEARQALAAAEAAQASADGQYTPLGERFPSTSTGRRLALARWIASPQNPRTARVAVNHIWLRHFGQALVPTVANFGINGQPPSHPELLDWLAAEFMDNGWRMKPLHRRIVLSATYRQSSASGDDRDARARDPENRYLWRMNSRRMEAEVVRDSVLFTAASLDLSRGGPEISEREGQTVLRRSLYFRNTPNESMQFLESFDAPNPNECYRRQESVVPHQALAMMNSSLAMDHARGVAEQLSEAVGGEDDEAARREFITAAFESLLTRSPTETELAACERFLKENTLLVQSSDQTAFPAVDETFRRPPSPVPYQRARENLILVLYSHNDFVTIR